MIHYPIPHPQATTVASSSSTSATDWLYPRPRPQDAAAMEYAKAMAQVLEREGLPLQDEADLDPLMEVRCGRSAALLA